MTHPLYPSNSRIFDSWLALCEYTIELATEHVTGAIKAAVDELSDEMLATAEEYEPPEKPRHERFYPKEADPEEPASGPVIDSPWGAAALQRKVPHRKSKVGAVLQAAAVPTGSEGVVP